MNEIMENKLKSKVYSALSEIVFDMETKDGVIVNEKDMEKQVEWFMIHFYGDIK